MSDLIRTSPNDFTATGDDVETGFKNDDTDLKNIYSHLNKLRNGYRGATPPQSPNVGDVWTDSSGSEDVEKKWSGTEWTLKPIDERCEVSLTDFTKQIKVADIITKGPIVDVRSFGAKGDGVTDDTLAIQTALNASRDILITDGVYMINTATPLIPQSNQRITLSSNTVLKAIANSQDLYRIINITDKSNIAIKGGGIVGDRDTHTGTTGEWGHGINIQGSNNITIDSINISGCWGDGIFIGKSDTNHSSNIKIDNVVSTNNRRQGLSLTDGDTVSIRDSVFELTNGTNPQAGIDIEPNNDCYVKNVNITNVNCRSNTGSGLQILGTVGTISNINLINVSGTLNTSNGLLVDTASDINFYNCHFDNNTQIGAYIPKNVENINFYSSTTKSNGSVGCALTFVAGQTSLSKNINFFNCDFSGNTSHNMSLNSSDYTNYAPKNITFNNCISRNSGARGISIGYGGVSFDNIQLNNCISENNISTDVIPTNIKQMFQVYGEVSAAPNSGTWNRGNKLYNVSPSIGVPIGWVCVTSGTFGTLSGVTGSITSGTATLTVNIATGLMIGNYINIVGVTGLKKIIALSGTTVTIDSSANATVTGAAVAYSPAVFKGFGVIQA